MMSKTARGLARALFRMAVRRLAARFPDDSEAGLVEVFDAAQSAACDARGWRGLLGCWAAESRSLLQLAYGRDRMVEVVPMVASTPRLGLLSCLRHDVRDARRALWRAPGYAVVVVLTLALGIGANTAVFSIVDALLFKPLPYANPEQLVLVAERHPRGSRNSVAPANFLDWRALATSFEGLEARHAGSFSLALLDGGPPVEVRGARVTAGYFALLGVDAGVGRVFQPGDDLPASPCATVISHRLWVSQFGADPEAIGRTLRFAGQVCTLIGVLPADSVFDRTVTDAYFPLVLVPGSASRESHFLTVFGRLRPGVPLDQARAEMTTIAAAIHHANADQRLEWSAAVDPMRDVIVRDNSRRLVWVLFGAVAVVLLVACANVAGLSLARGVWRRREVAVRVALGAGRWRVVRHLAVESLMLASLGGALGIVAGGWILRAAEAVLPSGTLPPEAMASLDWRALAFTGGIAILTALLSGLLPAWQSVRASVVSGLQGRGQTGSLSLRRLQSGLVVVEVALATVLVVGATLLVVSFARLTGVGPGFEPDRLLTFRVALPGSYTSNDQVTAFYQRAIEGIERLGGVESAAAVTSLPLGGWLYGTTFVVEGASFDPERPPAAHIQHVAGRYFETLGIPILEGRDFEPTDDARAPLVMMVNETFARRYLGDGPVIGRRVHLGEPDDPVVTVVGLMRNVKTQSLSDGDLEIPEVYVPHAQAPMSSMLVAVRTRSADPLDVLPDVRAAVASIDGEVPLGSPLPMTARIGSSVTMERFQTSVMSTFGALALLLACLGVYAIRSQAVASRRREVGIRVALGATRSQIVGLVLSQGARVVALGLVIGVAVALGVGRVIEQWLFDTPYTDPGGLAAAAAVIAAAALAASWLPARRAAGGDPVAALRADGGEAC